MSSELKLSLENFQSISKGELIFHKGLNFIIGQSNSGKSATFRALKACLSNPSSSKRFIKKGTRRASVKLEYNGNQIVWNRTAGESSYTINGEDYIKTGKSSALKILGDETGFVTDSNDVIMNIEEELQLPFPFGLSGSDLFKLYEEVFCISDSATILKQAKAQEDSVKEKISQLELDIQKYNLKLSELDKFKSEVDINKLKQYASLLRNKREEQERLKEGLPMIKKAVIADSIDCPSLKSFSNLELNYRDKIATKSDLKQLREICSLDKKIKDIKEADFTESNLIKYKELVHLSGETKRISNLSKIKIKDVTVADRLPELTELKELQRIKEECSLLDISISIKSFTNLLQKYNELVEYKKELGNIIKEGKDLQQSFGVQAKKIKELEDKLSSYDVCPLCHRPLEGGK